MKVAFIVGTFPVLSETFILNQITGTIERGHDVDIYADKRGDVTKVHPDVDQYRLLDRTYYLPEIPENLLQRVQQGIGLFVANFLKNPLATLQSINMFQHGMDAVSLWPLYTVIPSQRKSYDIIHCQFGTQGFRGMAFRSVNSPNAKLITTFRGHDISNFVKERGEQVYDRLFNVGDFFLSNCEFFRQRAIQLGCDADRILVHFSGLDCGKFTFTPRSFPADGRIRIATTGRLVEKKGIEYAIRAVAQQAQLHPNLEYNIIGDGPLMPQFQHLIHSLNVGHIINLVGWKNEREIIEILDRSHLFVAPSVTAEDGNQDAPINVLKEAMAMGLPVISTYHGGIPELVEDGVSGFLVPERDADMLAEKLGYLMDHPERWQAMGKAGRACVEQRFDIHKLNDRLIEVYQQVLNAEPKPQSVRSAIVRSELT